MVRANTGPAAHLLARGVPVLVSNEHVGQHLKDKMLYGDRFLKTEICMREECSKGVVERSVIDCDSGGLLKA